VPSKDPYRFAFERTQGTPEGIEHTVLQGLSARSGEIRPRSPPYEYGQLLDFRHALPAFEAPAS
jgi:hypothetical protein